MDRDAVIAHGGMSFVKESFMERSDGAKVPLCVACGTIPIYNPKLNIKICPMCDGPVRFIGDNIHNLEVLPPLGRPKSKIVEVEMPYSTKLLTQEQETYLNLSMRFITTKGVSRLAPLEYSGTSSEIVKELPRLILPETVAPAYLEEVPETVLSVEQLRSMGMDVAKMSEEERAVFDAVADETPEGMSLEQQIQMNAMANLRDSAALGNTATIEDVMESNSDRMFPESMTATVAPPPAVSAVMSGGLPIPSLTDVVGGEGLVKGPSVPAAGPVIAIRTDEEAFAMDGIMRDMGGMRPIRRNPFRSMGGMMGPAMPRYTPSMGGGAGANPNGGAGFASVSHSSPLRVTKLE
jgi:hypothetical protein